MDRYFPFFKFEMATGCTAWKEGTALSLEEPEAVTEDALRDARPKLPAGNEYTGAVELVPVDGPRTTLAPGGSTG